MDDDNAQRLRELAYRSKAPFKRVVNQVLRQGLDAERVEEKEPPYRVKASPMGLRAGLDPSKLSQFEAELDVASLALRLQATFHRADTDFRRFHGLKVFDPIND